MSRIQQSPGIQQLLRAEKEAEAKVKEARIQKARRLKRAKDEALKEVEEFRAVKDKEYKKKEEEILGSKNELEMYIARSSETKLKTLEEDVKKNKEAALERILALVYDIKPELHINYQSRSALPQK